MVTISLCMIVKNEEKVLARCLNSIKDLMDEIIIVDTGSTDRTREIAAKYTDKVYDFVWVNDFSAARNFAFSKASCDYIYSADADEVIDEENREKFRSLKEVLLPEVEIVQMYYANQLSCGTVYNFDKELRPKLFKRLRTFCWIEPVHETVRLLPVVFDSEIEIMHLPENLHTGRDLEIFKRMIDRGEVLSQRLFDFYARELFVSGSVEDFRQAEDYFTRIVDGEETSAEQLKAEYEAKLKDIDKEAEGILSDARKRALENENRIIAQAKEEAAAIMERARVEAQLEKQKAADDVKREMVVLASLMAGKVVKASIDTTVQESLVNETLKEIGESTWLS